MGAGERLEAHDAPLEPAVPYLARELAGVRPDIEDKTDTERVESPEELPCVALCRRA